MQTEFKEKQRFTQWWLWLLLGGIGLIPIYGIYKQLIMGEQFGTKPSSNMELIAVSILIFSIVLFFWILELKTEIDKDGIRINFFPFSKKNIKWNEIKRAEIINYGFIGGWGVRLGTKYGTVYNTKGKIGLAIELNNGKKFLIGTQKDAELKAVIDKIMN